jgi:hypothetical protein
LQDAKDFEAALSQAMCEVHCMILTVRLGHCSH